MRKTIVVVTLVLVALFAVGCTGGGTSRSDRKSGSKDASATAQKGVDKDGMRTFKDPKGVFTVKYPAAWYANGASDQAVEISAKKANTTMRGERDVSVAAIEIVVAPATGKKLDFGQLVDESVDGLIKAKPAAIRDKVEPISVSGAPGAFASVLMSTKSGEQVKMFIAMGGADKRNVRVMGFSPPKDWEKNLATFKAITKSLKFEESKA